MDLVGISASNRLAALLGINSAVLKQASREVEWYYRALQVRRGVVLWSRAAEAGWYSLSARGVQGGALHT